MVGALEKEIRLSFAARIRGTLPEDIQPLISEAKEKDTPEFKYNSDGKHVRSIIMHLLMPIQNRNTIRWIGQRASSPPPHKSRRHRDSDPAHHN